MPKWIIGEDVWNAAFGIGRIVAIDEQTATVFVSATGWEIKIQPSLLLPVFGPPAFVGPLDTAPSPEWSPKVDSEEEDSEAVTEIGSAAMETTPAPKRRGRRHSLHHAKN